MTDDLKAKIEKVRERLAAEKSEAIPEIGLDPAADTADCATDESVAESVKSIRGSYLLAGYRGNRPFMKTPLPIARSYGFVSHF
jgi:hypothetical protein